MRSVQVVAESDVQRGKRANLKTDPADTVLHCTVPLYCTMQESRECRSSCRSSRGCFLFVLPTQATTVTPTLIKPEPLCRNYHSTSKRCSLSIDGLTKLPFRSLHMVTWTWLDRTLRIMRDDIFLMIRRHMDLPGLNSRIRFFGQFHESIGRKLASSHPILCTASNTKYTALDPHEMDQ